MLQQAIKLILLLLISVLTSCQFIKEPPVFNTWVSEEVAKVDWSQVDELPTIEPCLIFRSRALKKECFFAIISDSIYTKLLKGNNNFGLYTKIDTVRLVVTITSDNQLLFATKYNTGISEFEKQKVDSIIKNRLISFPKVYPAIKRGLPVTSNFEIPLVLLPSKKVK